MTEKTDTWYGHCSPSQKELATRERFHAENAYLS